MSDRLSRFSNGSFRRRAGILLIIVGMALAVVGIHETTIAADRKENFQRSPTRYVAMSRSVDTLAPLREAADPAWRDLASPNWPAPPPANMPAWTTAASARSCCAASARPTPHSPGPLSGT